MGKLEELRLTLKENPRGLDVGSLRENNKKQALEYLDRELRSISWLKAMCEEREETEDEERQAAAVVSRHDPVGTLQRLRQGDEVSAPLAIEVSERA